MKERRGRKRRNKNKGRRNKRRGKGKQGIHKEVKREQEEK